MDLDIVRRGLVAPARIDPTGTSGPTRGQAHGPSWRTTSENRFVPIDVDSAAVEQRIVEAIASMPPGSAVTGWAALHWLGANWFGGRDRLGEERPIPIATNDQVGLRARPGVRLLHGYLLPGDLLDIDGLPITRPERSVFNEVSRAVTFESAVQAISMACTSDLVSLQEMALYAGRLGTRQFSRRLKNAIEWSDENLWSPMEATMYLLWGDLRRSRPLTNQPIFDRAGRHLLTPDLADVEAGVFGQYDGVVHELQRVRRRDLAKEELCRELGIEVVTMISTDLTDVDSFARRLEAAYRRAAQRPTRPADRGWTIEQPPWWVDTSTAARRRALSDEQRLDWLGWRAG